MKYCLIIIGLFVAKNVVGENILSRSKRYLVFPEGSSLSLAICMTAQTGITPGEIFTEGLNWGISYELPNDTKSFKDLFGPKYLIKRRNRRDVYSKMETVMNSMGYNGRVCVLRALCETSHQWSPLGEGLVDTILKIVFGYPKQRVLPSEPEEHRLYHWASHVVAKVENQKCEELFRCPFSLVNLALGYYSNYIT